MFRHFFFIPCVFFASMPALPLRAYGEPALSVSWSGEKISLTETATLKLSIEWPKEEGEYSLALPRLEMTHLSILRQGESQETFLREKGEWRQKIFEIVFKPEIEGEARVKSFILGYVEPTLSKTGQFVVPEMRILITKPLRGPLISASPILMVVSVLLFCMLGFYLYRKNHPAAVSVSSPTSQDSAIQKLKALMDHAESKNRKQMIFDLSGELRHFIAAWYKLDSKSTTEQEIPEQLLRQGYPRQEIEALQKLLYKLHEAKFTGMTTTDQDFGSLAKEVLDFVESKRVQGGVS